MTLFLFCCCFLYALVLGQSPPNVVIRPLPVIPNGDDPGSFEENDSLAFGEKDRNVTPGPEIPTPTQTAEPGACQVGCTAIVPDVTIYKWIPVTITATSTVETVNLIVNPKYFPNVTGTSRKYNYPNDESHPNNLFPTDEAGAVYTTFRWSVDDRISVIFPTPFVETKMDVAIIGNPSATDDACVPAQTSVAKIEPAPGQSRYIMGGPQDYNQSIMETGDTRHWRLVPWQSYPLAAESLLNMTNLPMLALGRCKSFGHQALFRPPDVPENGIKFVTSTVTLTRNDTRDPRFNEAIGLTKKPATSLAGPGPEPITPVSQIVPPGKQPSRGGGRDVPPPKHHPNYPNIEQAPQSSQGTLSVASAQGTFGVMGSQGAAGVAAPKIWQTVHKETPANKLSGPETAIPQMQSMISPGPTTAIPGPTPQLQGPGPQQTGSNKPPAEIVQKPGSLADQVFAPLGGEKEPPRVGTGGQSGLGSGKNAPAPIVVNGQTLRPKTADTWVADDGQELRVGGPTIQLSSGQKGSGNKMNVGLSSASGGRNVLVVDGASMTLGNGNTPAATGLGKSGKSGGKTGGGRGSSSGSGTDSGLGGSGGMGFDGEDGDDWFSGGSSTGSSAGISGSKQGGPKPAVYEAGAESVSVKWNAAVITGFLTFVVVF